MLISLFPLFLLLINPFMSSCRSAPNWIHSFYKLLQLVYLIHKALPNLVKYNTYAILDKFAYSWYSIHFPFASWIHEILNDFVSLNAILKQFDLTKQNCRDKKTHVKSFLSFNVHYLGCYEPFLSNKRKFSKLHIFCILNFLH